jgi:cell division protein FtsB
MRGIKSRGENKWKRLATFFALLLVFGFLLNSLKNVYQKKIEAQKLLTQMEGDKAKLEERDQFLKESIAKLGTPEGVNFEIRQKLNVAGAGESVAVIVDEQQPTSTPASQISAWQKIKVFFINLFK